jgi:hypothetical protein
MRRRTTPSPSGRSTAYGAHRGRTDSFVLIPLDPTLPKETAGSSSTPTRVEVSLKDVQVTKGPDIDVGLRGSINIVSGDKGTVSGQILLKNGGHISAQDVRRRERDRHLRRGRFVQSPNCPQSRLDREGAWLADMLRGDSLPAFERRLRRYVRPRLLVLDEIG